MPIVPMRFEDTPLLWTVPNVLSPDECAEHIQWIEAQNPTLATNNPLYRNQDRVVRSDPQLATLLFQRLEAHLPETMGGLARAKLNDLFRFYRYSPGQQFAPHTDHWYRPDALHITLLTVLVYFNGSFEGGETTFTEEIEATVVPEPGLAAVFQHKIRHAGAPVTSGKKYAVRTDVIYRATEPIVLAHELTNP